MAGRPVEVLDYEELRNLLQSGISKSNIARHFDISRPALDRIIDDHDLNALTQWTNITNAQLDQLLHEAITSLPFLGERMIAGFLRTKNIKIQRKRVREAIQRVDPEGLAQRKQLLHKRIKRRIYSVPKPHSLWHIDGNHKLVRWGMFVHCAIDGYSRACLYLRCNNNNLSGTVFDLFQSAVRRFNVIPTAVRSDYGTENVKVWDAMTMNNSQTSSPSVILGSSVHNQRVERFNRDINRNIKQKFAMLFYLLEGRGLLNVDCELDLFALHYVLIPRINQALSMLANCHNNHNIRTEGNWTPRQILSANNHYTPEHICGDISGRNLHYQCRTAVLDDYDFDHLAQTVPPLTEDNDHGCTVFEAVREFVHLNA